MKNLKHLFVSLLLVAFAFFLSAPKCVATTFERDIVVETSADFNETVLEQKLEVFDREITYDVNYIDDGQVMPYALLSPSYVSNNNSIPLIVWLHDRNEQNISEEEFLEKGILKVISDWELTNFNAYIICPQMKGQYYSEYWCSPQVQTNLEDLLDKFISEHNVDTNKIIIAGANLGGQGTLYLSAKMESYFSRAVVFSGYSCGVNYSDVKIPAVGYLADYGEHKDVTNYMKAYFAKGVEHHLMRITTYRSELLSVVFNSDKDKNGRADIVEWMLCDKELY